MARLNPNPRIEKRKDFRNRRHLLWGCIQPGIGARRWASKEYEHRLRRQWRDGRWNDSESVSPTRFTHRHSALWDIGW